MRIHHEAHFDGLSGVDRPQVRDNFPVLSAPIV